MQKCIYVNNENNDNDHAAINIKLRLYELFLHYSTLFFFLQNTFNGISGWYECVVYVEEGQTA